MTYGSSVPQPSGFTVTRTHQYPPTYAAATDGPEESSPPPLFSSLASQGGENKDADAAVSVREIMRTPSPTPTEARALSEKTRTCNLNSLPRMVQWQRLKTKRGAWTFIAAVSILGLFITFLAEKSTIENALLPFSDWLHDTPGAWLIPIAIMFVLSFPPLFGHELVGIICGDVWGLWLGFAIFGAGTVLGELGNYYAFKWFCGVRGKKLEESQLKYALYAQVIREGGLKVPVIMRFSFIPSHFTTAIFSTCGMNVLIFLASAILSLPKQLAVVYLGVSQNDDGSTTGAQKGIKAGVIIFSAMLTIFAMVYIDKKVDEVKHRVVYARRKARQAKAFAAASAGDDPDADADVIAGVPRPEFPTVSTTALSSGTTLEGATSPAKRHFPHAPQPSTGSAVIHIHAPSPLSQRSTGAAKFPAHPMRVRTAFGERGADVDLEMGVKRGHSVDAARRSSASGQPGMGSGGVGSESRFGWTRPLGRGATATPLTGAYGASAGGRAVSGGGHAWSES